MSDTGQGSLLFKRDTAELKVHLERLTGNAIALLITDNVVSMLSVREKNGLVIVRLNSMFLLADDNLLNEIARFIKTRKGKTPLISRFIKQNTGEIKKRSGRKITVRTAGRHFDLAVLFDKINLSYFDGRIKYMITWGTRQKKYASRKRTLGSCDRRAGIIKINPLLDDRSIPAYYIEYVIYHEMLHADLETVLKNGRRVVHSQEFKRRERLFEHYEKVVAWEKMR